MVHSPDSPRVVKTAKKLSHPRTIYFRPIKIDTRLGTARGYKNGGDSPRPVLSSLLLAIASALHELASSEKEKKS